jgi:hypothetical protein
MFVGEIQVLENEGKFLLKLLKHVAHVKRITNSVPILYQRPFFKGLKMLSFKSGIDTERHITFPSKLP